MSATRTFFNASRPLFRKPLASTWRTTARASPSRAANFRNGTKNTGRRWQSTTAGPGAPESWFKRMWDSPIGLKTVHFWAPMMKWALVLAGVSDFARPVEKLSFTQNLALTMTGLIWTRWCLIIKPRNILLAAVNFFLGCVGLVQITRIAIYEAKKKSTSTVEDVKAEPEEVKA